jgi:hypothetical protein
MVKKRYFSGTFYFILGKVFYDLYLQIIFIIHP